MSALPENAKNWTGHVSREGWGPGPWDGEPDKVSWTDAATGRPCLIVRNRLGGLCGYVAVDPGHSLHGAGYDDAHVDVHGGLTYSDRCHEADTEASGICHVPAPGQPEDVWWFGFDCVHAGDLAPGMLASSRRVGLGTGVYRNDTYRAVDYVVREVEGLARQLVEATS